ncbi:formate dehydrogenase subunit gamma [Limimaricola cinnabarinus]|jgi:formate dehydrogenase subunit gamma|uniref:NAD-dependent formate dehydrogenase gamma subunit n=1 Tax=Limimaricola cinnabarinus LL-001 TaxID=1337093 RepID=U3A9I9_9RHOB|nr:formate dehydrogenase subunit gamma [Limimaricola cinnabarinus]GAD54314.1 NAD-dependent formate dehydrogenase gamma subunit [Limimaricola cinnabarinus LL-001]
MPTPPAPADLEGRLGAILADHATFEGPLLPILHAVQAEWGYVPPEALPIIAEGLNISRAEVHGVVSFYHDFREEPAGRHMLKICRAEACQARGGQGIEAAAKARLGVDWHGTSSKGGVTLEPVYCLGLCANGPAMMLDGRVVARVDEARLKSLLEEVDA